MTVARTSAVVLAAVLLLGCDDSSDPADEGAADTMADPDDGGSAGDDGGDDAADDGGDDAPAATGQVALRFEVGSSASGSMNLEDPLMGKMYGGIFLTSDVSVTGPRDDAEQFASVETEGDVDLTAEGAVSEVVWTSEGLEPGNYTFLGYFDVDASSIDLEEKDPDAGDPVTLPTVNTFTIEAGSTVELTVRFDLVFS